MSDVSILHLSDIHAGSGALVDEDAKERIDPAARPSLLARLSNYVGSLSRRPDYVVVSGDITIRGGLEGLEVFRDWLIDHIEKGLLPGSERIMIVPGNHDVVRRMRIAPNDHLRFENFWNGFAKTFPHAAIPILDPLPRPLSRLKSDARGLHGGIVTKRTHGRIELTQSSPYILDLDSDVLIYGLNSAHACGWPLAPDPAILGPIQKIVAMQPDGPGIDDLEKAGELYLNSLVVDAGLIGTDQLTMFNETLQQMRARLGERFDKLTKVAVLHHHIGHLWRQQLELKKFETTIDAALLKQYLTEHAFDLVLHGHKHTNHVGLDGALIPIDEANRFNPLCVVSGGTVGGAPRLNDRQSIKLIELIGATGPRTRALVKEIPLLDSARPASVIDSKSTRIFQVPLNHRLPELHDFASVKDSFDQEIISKKAPELLSSEGYVSGATKLPSDQRLFSASARYECHSLLDTREEKTFYEIIQATKRIHFRTRARIHWLVVDAVGSAGDGNARKVVILVGDLEGTHYSEAVEPGEIDSSIRRLEIELEPAIRSGLVELRSHAFSQEDAVRLTLDRLA